MENIVIYVQYHFITYKAEITGNRFTINSNIFCAVYTIILSLFLF